MKRVLIADDNYITAGIFKDAIESSGHQVVAVAHSGKDAVSQAYALLPDIALLDIKMDHRTDGIWAAVSIKREYPEIKICFVSAYSRQSFYDDLIDVEYDEYIDKLNFVNSIPHLLL